MMANLKVGRQKAGRRADSTQRKLAQELVDIYQHAKASADQSYCPNPEAPPEERAYLDYNDPSLLLSALTCFAVHGTFTDPFNDGVNDMLIREEFRKLRATGTSSAEAVAAIASNHNSSLSTIERRLGHRQPVTRNDGD